MNDVRFSRRDPACCPAYKEYYIQDQLSGTDIYGHETYQYALFRKCPFQMIRKFRTRKQAYAYVSNLTGVDQWDVKWGSCRIVGNPRYDNLFGVIHAGKMYRINRRARTVEMAPLDDEQLSGWHDKYHECVAEAKRIIDAIDEGPQMSLFG